MLAFALPGWLNSADYLPEERVLVYQLAMQVIAKTRFAFKMSPPVAELACVARIDAWFSMADLFHISFSRPFRQLPFLEPVCSLRVVSCRTLMGLNLQQAIDVENARMELDEIRYSVQNVSKVIRFSEVQSEKLIDSVIEQTKDITRRKAVVDGAHFRVHLRGDSPAKGFCFQCTSHSEMCVCFEKSSCRWGSSASPTHNSTCWSTSIPTTTGWTSTMRWTIISSEVSESLILLHLRENQWLFFPLILQDVRISRYVNWNENASAIEPRTASASCVCCFRAASIQTSVVDSRLFLPNVGWNRIKQRAPMSWSGVCSFDLSSKCDVRFIGAVVHLYAGHFGSLSIWNCCFTSTGFHASYLYEHAFYFNRFYEAAIYFTFSVHFPYMNRLNGDSVIFI